MHGESVEAKASQAAKTGQFFQLAIPANALHDPDPGDSLSFKIRLADGSSLPDWLSFYPVNRMLSGTPGHADLGELRIKVIAIPRGPAEAVWQKKIV